MSNKLNSTVALAGILGIEPQAVQIAEEKGELENIITKFKTDNQVFTLMELEDFKRNSEKSFIQKITSGDNQIPNELYNYIKGAVLEKIERKLKREYDFSGNYENFNDLVEGIISESSKQPAESKKEDLEKIAELENTVNEYMKTAQQAEKYRNQILQFEDEKNKTVNEITGKYQNRILSDKLSRLINQIPFDDSDNEFTANLLKDGFRNKLSESVEWKFDENDNIIAVNKTTGGLLTDKVGNPLDIDKVVKQYVTEFKVPLKQPKQGDNIKSNTYGTTTIKTIDDALKVAEQKGITGLGNVVRFAEEQTAVHEK